MFATAELFGKFHSPKAPLQAARRQAAPLPPNELPKLFGPWLPAHLLSPTEQGPNSRQRIYSLRVTFWSFLWQILNPGSSCRQTLRKFQAWFGLLGGPQPKEDDSPYCQARRRLPRSLLERLLGVSAQAAEQRARQAWRFHDRDLKVADGTFCSAPDTPANRRAYPQSTNQKSGCGFPLVKLVALFSLTSGALLAVARGNQHSAELKLFRKLWKLLKKGDIFLADRAYCDYVTIVGLWLRGIDTVLRLHHVRPHDFRKGKPLGKYDRLVIWRKPARRTRTASRRLWDLLPAEITLRLIRYPVTIPGFRCREILLVTTLLDAALYPVAELAGLYARRWRIELFFRDIKTTMQMDSLSCRTPAMVYREVMMHLIAYNLLRCLMVQAAGLYDAGLERLSFKGTVDTLRQFSPVIALARSRQQKDQLIDLMLSTLVKDLLPVRPGRVEPRVRKRRPKPYPLMHQPRRQLKASLCRGKYGKKSRGLTTCHSAEVGCRARRWDVNRFNGFPAPSLAATFAGKFRNR